MTTIPTKERIQGRIWIPLAAFLITACAMLAACACFGVFPFGAKTLLTVDMDGQYVHFHAWLRRALLDGEGLFLSPRAGLGINALPLFAYYLASPLSLLTLLFPAAALPEALFFVTVLKIGLIGASYACFAQRVFGARRSSLIFAPCFALCGFAMCYASNIMWLDTLILLPLAMRATHSLVTRGRWGGLLLSLALLFVTQFYLAYMAGLLIFLCFLIMLWVNKPVRPWRTVLTFAGVTLAAALCCAVLLLPTALRLLHNAANANFEAGLTWAPMFGFFDPLQRAFPSAFDSIQGGLPPIYCGTLALLLLPPYFINARIPWRERLGFGIITLILMVSFLYSPITFFWHAFDVAGWFQFRFSFLLSFVWVWAAHRCFTQLEDLRVSAVLGGGAAALLYVTVLQTGNFQFQPNLAHSLVPWIVVIWTAMLLALRLACGGRGGLSRSPKAKAILAALCVAMVAAETCGNAYCTLLSIDEENSYEERAGYESFFAQREALLAQLPDEPDSPYRVDTESGYNRNDGFTLGYNSMQLYSSTADRVLGDTLMRFGINARGLVHGHAGITIAMDSLLGIRYQMEAEAPNDYYLPAAEQDGLTAYENPYAFPLLFAAPATVLENRLPPMPLEKMDWGMTPVRENVFELQNRMFGALSGDADAPPFAPLAIESDELDGLTREDHPDGSVELRFSEGAEGVPTERLLARTEGDGPVYAYWAIRTESGEGTLRSDGRELATMRLSKAPQACYVGDFWPDEEVALDFELESEGISLTRRDLYQLNISALEKANNDAYASQMYDLQWKGHKLSGTVDVTNERDTLLFTVPYDTGWSATVNGKTVPVQRGLDLFCAVPLSAGRNYVKLTYTPPGFTLGTAISLSAFAGLALLWLVRRIAEKRKRAA